VSLDTARVQDPKEEGPFVEYIRALLSGRKLDLIVSVGARPRTSCNGIGLSCFRRRR
jgi:hypothetical protein